MGIRFLVPNLNRHTLTLNMKLQFAILLTIAAFAAANQVDDLKDQFNAAKGQANSGMNKAIADAQNFLDQQNVQFDVKSQVDNAVAEALNRIKAQKFDQQAATLGKNAKKNVNQALKKIDNQKLRNNLINLLKNVEAEAKKAMNL